VESGESTIFFSTVHVFCLRLKKLVDPRPSARMTRNENKTWVPAPLF
jgi:hypothetical protein